MQERWTTAVRVECEHCHKFFEAPTTLRGALVNCEVCGRATQVPGSNDWAWRATVVLGVMIAIGAGLAVGVLSGPWFGLGLTLLLGALGFVLSRLL